QFYYQCCEEWAATGGIHFDGKSTLDAFLKGVRARCAGAWRERFRPEVKRFYFSAKATGTVPTYHRFATQAEADEQGRLRAVAQAVRDERFEAAQDDYRELLAQRRDAYADIPARLAAYRASEDERRQRQDLIRAASKQDLELNMEAQQQRARKLEREELERREVEKLA
ncbi:MAG: hypothetical protein AAFS07_19560, partial [Pseudomonadota bacterium]